MRLHSLLRPGTRSVRRAFLAGGAVVVALALLGCSETTAEPVATQVPRASTAVPLPEPRIYVVERQDTLARIARDTGVPLATLVELNEIADPNRIEVGEVLLLEEAPLPLPNPERSIVSREPVDRSLGTQLSDWWDGLYRPDLNLSDRSLSQGAVAGLMLPAAVLAFVALWMSWQGLRKVGVALTSVGARIFPGGGPRLAPDGAGGVSGSSAAMDPAVETAPSSERSGPSLWARTRAKLPTPSASIRRPHIQRPDLRWSMPSIDFSGLRHQLSKLAVATASGARRLLRTPAVVSRGVEARRERARKQAARQEAEAHWLTGAERLRIGLFDEAYESFNAALKVAREHGWQDEIDRNLAALDDIAARRRVAELDPGAEHTP
jgi:LysM repeat protein